MLHTKIIQAETLVSQGLYDLQSGQVDSQVVLRALAEPRRQAMLRLVKKQPLSAGAIGEHFEDITQQAVSQHLHVLADAGLVDVRRKGKQRIYALDPNGLKVLDEFLANLWPEGLKRLKRAVEADRRGS